MFITLKQKQHNSAMESGDHSKNGVSPKNQRSRGNFLMMMCIALLSSFFVLTGCKKDADNENSVSDPQGTITANISESSYFHVFYDDDNFAIVTVRWCSPDNFYLEKSYTWFYEENWKISICDLGSMKGLGNITIIPASGFTVPAYKNTSIACETKHGYVIKCERIGLGQVVYVRLYVEESIISTSGGIMGAKVKYQYPFEP